MKQLFKSILPYALFFALLFTVLNFQFCQQKLASTGDGNTFPVVIADQSFTAENKDIPDLPAERSPADVIKASEYLLNVAIAGNISAKIAEALKDKKKVLPAFWALTPILISDLPALITAGKSLAKFQDFYIASGGLTADERAIVANQFAMQLAIPYPVAEAISEATIEAALANMKLVFTVSSSVKK